MVFPKRFEDKIDFSGDCWIWKAYITKSGYGSYRHGNSMVLAHRFIWSVVNGVIPEGLCVLHKCDVRNCVNPDHLFLGSNQDNVDDRVIKGREGERTGEKNGRSKLNKEQVEEIRKLYKRGTNIKNEFSQRGLAKRFGVSNVVISGVVNNRSWVE